MKLRVSLILFNKSISMWKWAHIHELHFLSHNHSQMDEETHLNNRLHINACAPFHHSVNEKNGKDVQCNLTDGASSVRFSNIRAAVVMRGSDYIEPPY